MKLIQFNGNEVLNIESIESLYPHYLGGTVIIGKSGKTYTTSLPLERVLELIRDLEEN